MRLGESALIIGEIRGSEARVLYESMRTGRAGSAILGTIHGDSAKTVFDRVVYDMGISAESFMATDVLVTLGTFNDRTTGAQVRRMSDFVATSDRVGGFVNISESVDFGTPVMRRALATSGQTEQEALDEINARGDIRSLLAEKGKVDERYLGPEWINIANEYVSRYAGKSRENLVNGFKVKIESNMP